MPHELGLTGPDDPRAAGRLPNVLHLGDTGRVVNRDELQQLTPEELRSAWFTEPGEDGRGTRCVFAFIGPALPFAWRPK